MASGYAAHRPPVHPLVLQLVSRRLGGRRFQRALDIGCGAGLSTAALDILADRSIGIDPVLEMVRWAPGVARHASFAVGAAEAIPLRDGSVNLISAAGALNYVKLPEFFGEGRRVLAPGGILLVYDFSPGRAFRDSAALEEWFAEFQRRYPWPSSEATPIDPAFLASCDRRFDLAEQETFEIGLPLTCDFYVEYAMTETNVAAAVRAGAEESSIRSWCQETLGPVFQAERREVLFRGYFACMRIAPGS